jgi:predicted transcriptional regulator
MPRKKTVRQIRKEHEKELEKTKEEIKKMKEVQKPKPAPIINRVVKGDYVIVDQRGKYIRTYTVKDHGKDAQKFAVQFALKKGYRIIG